MNAFQPTKRPDPVDVSRRPAPTHPNEGAVIQARKAAQGLRLTNVALGLAGGRRGPKQMWQQRGKQAPRDWQNFATAHQSEDEKPGCDGYTGGLPARIRYQRARRQAVQNECTRHSQLVRDVLGGGGAGKRKTQRLQISRHDMTRRSGSAQSNHSRLFKKRACHPNAEMGVTLPQQKRPSLPA